MGWISKRKMQTGRGVGGGGRGQKHKGPLRKIVGVHSWGRSLFEQNHVALECGHDTWSNGAVRARCRKCKDA